MKFRTLSGIEYQMDVDDALRFVGISITMCSNGYLGIKSHNWTGDSYVHREIMDSNCGDIIDHINGDKLDIRRCNLRKCTQQENSYNARLRTNNKTGVRGVYWDKTRLRWSAYITASKKRYCLGRFNDFEEACAVRAEAERRLHGEHAAINGVLASNKTGQGKV